MNVCRTIPALLLMLLLTPCLWAQMPRMEHRFEGLVADAFMADDGSKIWTAEDGGRIRFRDGSLPWVYLDTPDQVQNTIRAIHFLPNPANGSWSPMTSLVGFIVGDDAKLHITADGGMSWSYLTQVTEPPPLAPSYTGHLRDINFVRNPVLATGATGSNPTGMFGVLVGLHGMWRSLVTVGDFSSNPVALVDLGGNPINPADVELYAVDILQCGSNEPIIIAVGEPGVVFRNKSFTNPLLWGSVMELIWDVRDQSEEDLSVCGSNLNYKRIHETTPARMEIWDVEIQRTCAGNPLVVMVAGGSGLTGTAWSSTDLGSTFVMECHECETSINCTGNTDYELTANHAHYKRHHEFNHLYGVAMFADGSACAGGYGGQHVVRRATDGVWEDRSQQGGWALEMVDDEPSFFLLNGAVCQRNAGSSSSNGKAFMVGQGGQGRSTTAANLTIPNPNPVGQPAENWSRDWTLGEQSGWWRMEATVFNAPEQGWRTGQSYHVAMTTDGGLNWTLENVLPYGDLLFFRSIAISPNANDMGGSGVAVGQADPRDRATSPYGCSTQFVGHSKVLRRAAVQGAINWIEPNSIKWLSSFVATGKELRDVAYAATVGTGDVYWACGQVEMLLRSLDGGYSWIQSPYPSGSPAGEFNALAFVDQDRGVVVGRNTSTGAACAYGVDAGAATPAYDISPSGVVELFDVAYSASNQTAYAVGSVNTVNNGLKGQVFSSTLGPTGFTAFAPITTPQPDDPALGGVGICQIGDIVNFPPLGSVAVATNGDVWVGGVCGRVWRSNFPGNWEEIKSQTDGHILDLAAAPGGFVYATSMRANLTGPGLVRWNPGSQ